MKGASEDELIAHAQAIAREIPLVGFYLQPAVGGHRSAGVVLAPLCRRSRTWSAIKIAPFNRYRTLDVVRGVVEAGAADRITLYTGNDDHIVLDLLTPFTVMTHGRPTTVRIKGGLLGHWSVWVKRAVELLARIHAAVAAGSVPADLLALDSQVTDCNAAIFDVANDFHGVIAGCHEILRRQGLLEGIWCLDPNETLGPGPDSRRSTGSAPPIRSSTTTPSCARTWNDGCRELGLPARQLAPGGACPTMLRPNPTEAEEQPLAGHPQALQRYALAVSSHLALVVAWYLFVKLGEVPKFVMPSPYDTVHALLVPNYRWLENIAVTSIEIFGGYILAVVLGIGTALLFSWFRWLEMAVDAAARQPQHDPQSGARAADHRLVQLRHRAQRHDGLRHLLLSDRADHGARPARGRARPARSRAHAQGLALAGLHQDPASRRAALHLLRHEGRRDPGGRRRHRRRVPGLRPRARLPHAAGAGHARHRRDVHGGDPDHADRHGALRDGARARAHAGGARRAASDEAQPWANPSSISPACEDLPHARRRISRHLGGDLRRRGGRAGFAGRSLGLRQDHAAQNPRRPAPLRFRRGDHRLGGAAVRSRRATSAWCSSSRCC